MHSFPELQVECESRSSLLECLMVEGGQMVSPVFLAAPVCTMLGWMGGERECVMIQIPQTLTVLTETWQLVHVNVSSFALCS